MAKVMDFPICHKLFFMLYNMFLTKIEISFKKTKNTGVEARFSLGLHVVFTAPDRMV